MRILHIIMLSQKIIMNSIDGLMNFIHWILKFANVILFVYSNRFFHKKYSNFIHMACSDKDLKRILRSVQNKITRLSATGKEETNHKDI